MIFKKDKKRIDKYLSMGVMLQGNYKSLFGKYGKEAKKLLKYLLHDSEHYLIWSDALYKEGSDKGFASEESKKEEWNLLVCMFQRNTTDTKGMRVCLGRKPFTSSNGIQYAPLSFSVSYWDGDAPGAPVGEGFSTSNETPESGIKNRTEDGSGPVNYPRYGEVVELQEMMQNQKSGGKVTIHLWQDNE